MHLLQLLLPVHAVPRVLFPSISRVDPDIQGAPKSPSPADVETSPPGPKTFGTQQIHIINEIVPLK